MLDDLLKPTPGSGYTDASGINRYQPTAGEQKMLGDFNTRMAGNSTLEQTATPQPGADATGTLPGQAGYNQNGAQIRGVGQALFDSLPSGLSGRQTAKFSGMANDIDPTFQPPSISGLSGRQQAGLNFDLATPSGKRPRSSVFGYADGGKPETAEELMARISGKYNISSQPAAAPAPQAQAAPAPTPKPAGSMIQQAASIFSNRSKQIDKAVNGYAQGGKIKGPGTATSDSIPATTGTGENIRVANGERIVSVEQDKALERIAELLGYDSVDAMFEALTGKPVGPTMKGGQIGAADGASPDWMRVHMPGDRTSVDFNPTPVPANRTATGAIQEVGANLPSQPSMAADQGSPKIDPEELMKRVAASRGLEYKQPAPSTYVPPSAKPMPQFETVMTQSNQDINSVNSVGAKLHHAAKGVLASIPALAVDAYRGAAPRVAPLFTGEDYKPDTQAAPAAAPQAAPTPAPATAPQAATPVDQPPGSAIQAVAPTDLAGRQAQHMENNNLREFSDKGDGIVRQVDSKGKTTITNEGTAGITDATRRTMDSSAGALIERKNSTYNPQAQYERMVRNRMLSDATDPTITDPAVRANAYAALTAMNAGTTAAASAGLHNAQARGANVTADTAEQTAAMYKEYLDPKTNPARRKEVHDYLRALSGKTQGYKIATTSVPNPNGIGPNTQQAWGLNEDTGEVFNVEDRNKQQQKQQVPSIGDYAKAVRAHPNFKGKTLSDAQIQEMHKATYQGAK